MPKKNEMLVLIACDDKDARDQTAGLISDALTLARREGVGAINKVTDVKVEHCGVKAGSLLAIMEEFSPGLSVRMTKVLEKPKGTQELVTDSIIGIQIQSNAQLAHRLDVVRQIVKSERTDNIKIEELKHILDPRISMMGKPADVQAVIEMALYGQMPEGNTNATITYKDGKPCKTIGTF